MNRPRDVVHDNYEDLYRFAFRMTGHREAARDIVQETFFRLARDKAKHRSATDIRKWLFVVCRNLCITRIRKQANHREIPVDWIEERSSPTVGPDGRLSQAEQSQIVQDAVFSLPPKLREVILLREYEEMSYEDIAATAGCPIGTVRSRLALARKALREKLSPLLELES